MRGRGPVAYDCWGLVREVIQAGLGVSLPTFTEYSDTEIGGDGERMIREKRHTLAKWRSVETLAAQPFDLILLNIAGHPNHIGVVCENKSFLHVEKGATSCIEKYHSRRWALRIEGIYRHQL